jgi:SAM-dependent methyltransferase
LVNERYNPPALSDPMLSRINAQLAAFYDLRAAEEPSRDPEANLRFRKAIAAAALASNERILDIGAKWGGLAALVKAAGLSVKYVGFDLSEVNADSAREAGLTFVQGDANDQLPFDDASFDCVFCLELLEHVTAPVELLTETRRVLADTGRAVVSVPNPYSWVEVARELLGRPEPEGHLNCFPMSIIKNLAALSGFEIDRRLGTSIRIPKTLRLVSTDSILARSRIYVLRPSRNLVFAGRVLS